MPLRDPVAQNAYWKRWYRKRMAEPEFHAKYLNTVRLRNEKHRAAAKDLVAAFRAAGCAVCDESEVCCLSAHHLDPAAKDFDVGMGLDKALATIRAELKKCVCLCENCHRKVHAGIIKL